MLKRRTEKPIESMASILILGGVVPLCVALLGQYAFGLFPCHFCLLQRYPYALAILCGVASLLVKRMGPAWHAAVLIGALAFATTGAIGAYHTGVERGLINYTGGCVADSGFQGSLSDLKAQIMAAPRVSCADATPFFLHLSMASWNTIFAIAMLVLMALQYRFERSLRVHH